MRTSKERARLIHRRTAEIKQARRIKRQRRLDAACVAVCLLLPAAVAGGEVSAAAPHAAFLALCLADPMAWFAADLVMVIPFIRNILKMDYRYLYKRRA